MRHPRSLTLALAFVLIAGLLPNASWASSVGQRQAARQRLAPLGGHRHHHHRQQKPD